MNNCREITTLNYNTLESSMTESCCQPLEVLKINKFGANFKQNLKLSYKDQFIVCIGKNT